MENYLSYCIILYNIILSGYKQPNNLETTHSNFNYSDLKIRKKNYSKKDKLLI